MRPWLIAMTFAATLPTASLLAAGAASATIVNSKLEVILYLPEARTGFYQGTRFDWSGVVGSLRHGEHEFFGPWFNRHDASVHDFVYEGNEIVAGTCSATMGPVQEFSQIGYDQAKPGDLFLKIGVGLLRRPDDKPYDNYHTYEIVDYGTWTVDKGTDWITFAQKIDNATTGYGYVYTKTLRLVAGQPRMTIEHTLKSTGRIPLHGTVYDHNFLVMQSKGPQKTTTLLFPFTLTGTHSVPAEFATIGAKSITYNKTLEGKETIYTPIEGFGTSASDYDLRVESPAAGTGVHIVGDRPIVQMGLWSIRSTISIEPFLAIDLKQGDQMSWKYTYDFYTLAK